MRTIGTARTKEARGLLRRPSVVAAVVVFVIAVAGVVGWGVNSTTAGRSGLSVPVSGVKTPGTNISTPAPAPVGADERLLSTSPQGGSATAVKAGGAVLGLPQIGPKVVKTASLTLTVDGDLTAVAKRVQDVTTASKGYVASMDRTTSDSNSTTTMTLRVPSDSFDSVMDSLRGLGKVRELRVGGEDVTQQAIDLDARLRSLTSEADALRAILAEAKSIQDILSVREQLNQVQTQIEQLTAQKQNLAQQVALATITLSLATPGAVVVPPGPVPYWLSVLQDAGSRFLHVIGAIVVGAATLAPLALLGMIIWLGWRVSRRRGAPSEAPEAESTSNAP